MDIDLILDVLIDVCIDTAKLLPFLFATYLAMEALEHAAAGKTERLVAQAGKSGPAIGALLGALPQCGFSAMAATLYSGRVITVGTLVAVILSTSDEMVPVFLAHNEAPGRLAAIVAVKVAVGCAAGFALDFLVRARHAALPPVAEEDAREAIAGLVHDHDFDAAYAHDHGGHVHTHAHDHDHGGHVHTHAHVHDHAHDHDRAHGNATHILRSALSHTVEVALYLFLVSLVFGLFIEYVGEDHLAELLSVHPVRSTLLAALVGLIPNCGASVALTELFLAGTLPTGAMMAGLLVSGGVGLLVLFRANASLKRNLTIVAFVYLVGVACGLVVGASGILL